MPAGVAQCYGKNEKNEEARGSRASLRCAKGANRTRDTALFRRVLYQLSYLGVARAHPFDALDSNLATLMGLEPTTFAVTGRRSNQLSYSAKAGIRLGQLRKSPVTIDFFVYLAAPRTSKTGWPEPIPPFKCEPSGAGNAVPDLASAGGVFAVVNHKVPNEKGAALSFHEGA